MMQEKKRCGASNLFLLILVIIIIIIIIILLLLLLSFCYYYYCYFFFKQSQTWTEMLRKMDVAMFSFKIKLLKALGNFKHSPFLQKNNVEV